jgi:mannose/fructose/N-acetylgalactosamine-specific phosphotransferase system component IID
MTIPDQHQSTTITDTVSVLGSKVIAALPPAFLMLCLINVAFLGLVMWFLRDETTQKIAILNRVLDSCMGHK